MTRLVCIVAPCLLLLGGCASSGSKGTGPKTLGVAKPVRYGTIVQLEDCPKSVQATIADRLDGGRIMAIERITNQGSFHYIVEVRTDEGVKEFTVASDGTFGGYRNPNRMEITLDSVPRVVMGAAHDAVNGVLMVSKVYMEQKGTSQVYEIHATVDDVQQQIQVTPGGEVLEVKAGWDR